MRQFQGLQDSSGLKEYPVVFLEWLMTIDVLDKDLACEVEWELVDLTRGRESGSRVE